MRYTTTMTSKGQVTVPVEIRRRLGLRPGKQVEFEVVGDMVRIKNDNWRIELEALGGQVREHMQKQSLKPLSDDELAEARRTAAQEAATYRLKGNSY